MKGRRLALVLASLAILIAATLLAPMISAADLPPGAARRAMSDLHRPRALFGALAGFGLALSGVVLQSVLRNPLASPYTLGIASGGAVGAVLAIQLAGGGALSVSLGAMAGSCGTATLVYAVASLRRHAAETLLLTGVAVTLFAGAITTAVHFLALGNTPDLVAMVRWSMASLEVVGYGRVGVAGGLVALGTLILLPLLGRLDVASLDDASARGLGVDPVAVRRLAFLGTSVITAGVVAFAGPIGFVGLIVPHAVRPFTGPDPRVLLPCAACAGGAFLVGADVLARTLAYPTNLPVNVITYAIGCPAFVWILIRRPTA